MSLSLPGELVVDPQYSRVAHGSWFSERSAAMLNCAQSIALLVQFNPFVREVAFETPQRSAVASKGPGWPGVVVVVPVRVAMGDDATVVGLPSAPDQDTWMRWKSATADDVVTNSAT